MEKSNASEKKNTHVRGIIRPLIWWFFLVLVLFGIRTHQRLREQTRIVFAVTFQGRIADSAVSARLDGRPVESGELLPIGAHTFSVRHPKGVLFSTNFSVLYGKRDFGIIDLKRAEGTLRLEADPMATAIYVRGPEFQRSFYNTTGTNLHVPTDKYVVEAKYKYWDKSGSVEISEASTQTIHFNPPLGHLRLSCDREKTAFQLKRNGDLVESGELPSTLYGLPEGTYKVFAQNRGRRDESVVEIRAGLTNDVKIDFPYGAVVLETEPSGATVWSEENRELGQTPLTLSELDPGHLNLFIRLNDYEPVEVKLRIVGNETNRFRTNLVSTAYTRSIEQAHRYLASAQYAYAIASIDEALRATPNDPSAQALKKRAIETQQIESARKLNDTGDYLQAIQVLESLVKDSPDNSIASGLLSSYRSTLQRKEEETAKRKRFQDHERLGLVFLDQSKVLSDANAFDMHLLKCQKTIKETAQAISEAMKSKSSVMKIWEVSWENPNVFTMRAIQQTPEMLRVCLIAGGPSLEAETEILYKVLEYEKSGKDYVAVRSNKGELTKAQSQQIDEGFKLFSGLINQAIGDQGTERSSTLQ